MSYFAKVKVEPPEGFPELLRAFAKEVLREQPEDIHKFGATYFRDLYNQQTNKASKAPSKDLSQDTDDHNDGNHHEEAQTVQGVDEETNRQASVSADADANHVVDAAAEPIPPAPKEADEQLAQADDATAEDATETKFDSAVITEDSRAAETASSAAAAVNQDVNEDRTPGNAAGNSEAVEDDSTSQQQQPNPDDEEIETSAQQAQAAQEQDQPENQEVQQEETSEATDVSQPVDDTKPNEADSAAEQQAEEIDAEDDKEKTAVSEDASTATESETADADDSTQPQVSSVAGTDADAGADASKADHEGDEEEAASGEEQNGKQDTHADTTSADEANVDNKAATDDDDISAKLCAVIMPNEAMKEAAAIIADIDKLRDIWNSCDKNANGLVSLAEIGTMIRDRNWDISTPTQMRAYKKTTLRDGDGDAWVEKKEFKALLRNMFVFERMWDVFEDIDSSDDRRIDLDEFRVGLGKLGINMSDEVAAAEFSKADTDGKGKILFKEFCRYAGQACGFDVEGDDETWQDDAHGDSSSKRGSKSSNTTDKADEHDTHADISTTTFDELEKQFQEIMSADAIKEEWDALDYNGNNKVSLAEIDKWIIQRFPLLNNKPALMRAYKTTIHRDGDGDDWVEKKEFKALLRNVIFYNRLFEVFEDMDADNDRRVNFDEFKSGLEHVGLSLSDEEAKAEFDALDVNHGGQILFDEFCKWVAQRKIPVD